MLGRYSCRFQVAGGVRNMAPVRSPPVAAAAPVRSAGQVGHRGHDVPGDDVEVVQIVEVEHL